MKVGFVALCIAFSIAPLVNTQRTPPNNKDYDIWFTAGRHVANGEALYPEEAGRQYEYMYPPTLAIFVFAPMSMLGYTAFVALFIAANAVIWYATLQLSLRLFAGSSTRQSLLVFMLPFLVNTAFVYDTFLLGQVNVGLLLLMLAMFALLRSGKPWLAGGALALATAMKAFPLSALAYLIWRRQWQAAAATVVWLALILVVLPAPIRGFERNAHELTLWYRGMLADQSGNSIGQRSETGFTYKNQSLIAVVHRLTRARRRGRQRQSGLLRQRGKSVPSEDPSVLAGIRSDLDALAIYIFCMPGRRRQTLESLRCEEAMLLLMVIFCSPLAWTYFFCWTLPAWIVIVHMLANPAPAPPSDVAVGGCSASSGARDDDCPEPGIRSHRPGAGSDALRQRRPVFDPRMDYEKTGRASTSNRRGCRAGSRQQTDRGLALSTGINSTNVLPPANVLV